MGQLKKLTAKIIDNKYITIHLILVNELNLKNLLNISIIMVKSQPRLCPFAKLLNYLYTFFIFCLPFFFIFSSIVLINSQKYVWFVSVFLFRIGLVSVRIRHILLLRLLLSLCLLLCFKLSLGGWLIQRHHGKVEKLVYRLFGVLELH